jgi:hypothetical protein
MDGGLELTLMPCPACSAPAEITDHFWLPSTEGPVSFVVTQCLNEHHFRMPVEDFYDPRAWRVALAARHPAYEFERVPCGRRFKWSAKALRLGMRPWCVMTSDPRDFGRHLPPV